MNLSNKGYLNNKDTKFNTSTKITSLNPNAAEFIPSSFKLPLGNTKGSDSTRVDVPSPSVKSVFDRSESNVSNKSDDEAQQYWRDQLPDDITPDFKSMGEDDLPTPGQLSLATLSLYDGIETSRFLMSGNSQLFGTEQDISSHDIVNHNFGEKNGYLGSTFAEDQPSGAYMSSSTTDWDQRIISGGQQFTSRTDGNHYNGVSNTGLLNEYLSEQLEDAGINPVEFLASHFPGFAAESLADVYYANGCDLNLTIEMLTQLELQVDANFSQTTNSKSSEAPSFDMHDFPALSAPDSNNGASKFSGDDLHQASNTYGSPSSISRGSAVDFASTVRKLAARDSAQRKYERNNSADGIVNSSRSSQLLNSLYNSNSKLAYGDKVRSSAAGRTAPMWLETGEAVGSMYSDLREDARDFARLRNACFEQARQAYLIGNGALARDLSRKGQLYNMQMKAAHGKAKENIYRQRNPASLDARAQDRLIDLHGLHVTEAIQVLQHELRVLRSTARSAGQRLQVMICVGTGHHTKGARTPVRLPVAVEQFLLEEGLHFTHPQPGLLRVVVY